MDHQAKVHILRRPSAPGHLAPDQHHQQPLQPHDQAVNMAAPPVQKVRLSPVIVTLVTMSHVRASCTRCQGVTRTSPTSSTRDQGPSVRILPSAPSSDCLRCNYNDHGSVVSPLTSHISGT